MIRRIDHVGVLVRSLAEALPLYTELLGLRAEAPVELPEQAVRVAFLHAGDGLIELLEPMTPDCVLARVLAKRGEGLLHICLEVEDIEATLRRLEAAGVPLVDRHAWRSPHGLVAFIHPRAFRGVSIELRQPAREQAERAPRSSGAGPGGARSDATLETPGLRLQPEGPPLFDYALLQPPLLVSDLVFFPRETPFLRQARQQGCRTMNGLGMLLHQAVLSFERWTGMEAPVPLMRSALVQALEARERNG